jgi:hypothetical protein
VSAVAEIAKVSRSTVTNADADLAAETRRKPRETPKTAKPTERASARSSSSRTRSPMAPSV